LGVALVMMIATAPAQATAIKEFKLPAGSDPLGMTPGPGGDVWFTVGGSTHAIGRITPAGVIKEFMQGFTSNGEPGDITMGADGNLWFTAAGSPPNAIGRVTPQGKIKEFLAGVTGSGLNSGAAPSNITPGPGGTLWFLDDGNPKSIGRITRAGTIKEFTLPDPINDQAEDLTAGPDGNMWFTDRGNTRAIGRVTPNGVITEFTGTLDQLNSMPNGITTGPDHNLWFTDEGSPGALGRVKPSNPNNLGEFTTGLQSNAVPDAITAGSDGNVWFEDNYGIQRAIGRITPQGTIKEFTNSLGTGLQDDITLAIDGNVWVEQSMPGGIARITPAGAITEFTHGLLTGAGSDGDQLITGPDGNLWFSDRGAVAIGRVALQLPPTARTDGAQSVTRSAAKVHGSVNPRGAAASVKFQYGKSKNALGSSAEAGKLTASGHASEVTAQLSGLPAGTAIYYRVVATNAFGTRKGAIRSLRTAHG
jgi:streptogramin lyase